MRPPTDSPAYIAPVPKPRTSQLTLHYGMETGDQSLDLASHTLPVRPLEGKTSLSSNLVMCRTIYTLPFCFGNFILVSPLRKKYLPNGKADFFLCADFLLTQPGDEIFATSDTCS